MPNNSRSEEIQPSLEMIGDLIFSPKTDIPFGKRLRIGIKEEIIYESVIEKGYNAGIIAHRTFLKDHGGTEPVVLDDKQFTMIIKHFLPKKLSESEKGLWRSFFIIGWTCVYLEIVATEE